MTILQSSSTTQGHNMRYIQLAARINTSYPSTTQLWNSLLSEEIVFSPDFDHFNPLGFSIFKCTLYSVFCASEIINLDCTFSAFG